MPLDAVVEPTAHKVDDTRNVVWCVFRKHLDDDATMDGVQVDDLQPLRWYCARVIA